MDECAAKERVEVAEMKCLRTISGVRRIERVRNERVRMMCGDKKGIVERAGEGVLRWFGHMERMSDERMVKRIYESDVEGRRRAGRPRRRWLDGVEELVRWRGGDMQVARECVRDRERWSEWYRGFN